jgi:acetyl esterase/lipase
MHDAAPADYQKIEKLEFVRRGDQVLCGDLYLPSQANKAPCVIAAHGGAWQRGGPSSYHDIGPYLASKGIAVFAVTYRFAPKAVFPAALHDVRAAVQFIRSKGAGLGIDPDRLALMGDSAGGHLAALTALAGDREDFVGQADDAYKGVSTKVKVCAPVYGIYDLVAQWEYDQAFAPRGNFTETFIGLSGADDRFAYQLASPLNYVSRQNNKTAFFMAWGTRDDIVPPSLQSERLLAALKRADYYVRNATVDAGHFWIHDPLHEANSFPGFVIPRLYRFLKEKL